jgi:hypothetical protein
MDQYIDRDEYRRDGPPTRLGPGALMNYARLCVARLRLRQTRVYQDLQRLGLFQRYLRQRGVPDGEYPARVVSEFLSTVRDRLGESEHGLFSRAIYGFLLDRGVKPIPVRPRLEPAPLAAVRPPRPRPTWRGLTWFGPVFRTGSLVTLGAMLAFFPFFSYTSPLPPQAPVTMVRGRINTVGAEMVNSGNVLSAAVASRPTPLLTAGPIEPTRTIPRFIHDPDGLLAPWQRALLADYCLSLIAMTGIRPMVVTVEQIKMERTEELAGDLMASEGTSRTVLLLIVSRRRAVHLRVGRDLWGAIDPAMCGRILDRHVVPYLRLGKIDRAIKNGLAAVADAASHRRALAER